MQLFSALTDPARLRRIALIWIALSAVMLGLNFYLSCATNSALPCMADYPDFAMGSALMLHGRAHDIYDLARFQQAAEAAVPHARDIYQYAYPPFLPLLTAPLGALPWSAGWLLWMGGGWLALALFFRRHVKEHWLLAAAAMPAVFINAVGGQNGLWTAAIFGWGLTLAESAPLRAGLLLSLLLYKPQLAFLVPLALIAGRQWRVLAGFVLGAVVLALLPAALFGPAIWAEFAAHAAAVRVAILENGATIWHRMLSVFVLVRHAGGSVRAAYAAQGVATLAAALAVAKIWRSSAPRPEKNAALVLAAVLAAPYVFDYDLAVLALIPVWLSAWPIHRRALAGAVCILLPVAEAPAAASTGLALGSVAIAPLLALIARRPGTELKTPASFPRRYTTRVDTVSPGGLGGMAHLPQSSTLPPTPQTHGRP